MGRGRGWTRRAMARAGLGLPLLALGGQQASAAGELPWHHLPGGGFRNPPAPPLPAAPPSPRPASLPTGSPSREAASNASAASPYPRASSAPSACSSRFGRVAVIPGAEHAPIPTSCDRIGQDESHLPLRCRTPVDRGVSAPKIFTRVRILTAPSCPARGLPPPERRRDATAKRQMKVIYPYSVAFRADLPPKSPSRKLDACRPAPPLGTRSSPPARS